MSKFDSEKWENLLEATRWGGDIMAACWASGLSPKEVISWLSIGYRVANGMLRPSKSREGALEDFMEYSRAHGQAVMTMTRALMTSAKDGEWRAAQMWLEKQHSMAWGKFAGMEEKGFPEIEAGGAE